MGEAKRRRLLALRTARCALSPPSRVWLHGWRAHDRDHSRCATPDVQLVPCRSRPATVAEHLLLAERRRQEEAERVRARQVAEEAARIERERREQERAAAIARGEPAPVESRPHQPRVRAAMLFAMLTGLMAGTGVLDVPPAPKRRCDEG